MSVGPAEILDAAVDLYTYAGNSYAVQWNLVSVVIFGYLTLLFTDIAEKLSKVGHYILLFVVLYYLYLSSTWILQSIDLLNNSSELIKQYLAGDVYKGMSTLSDFDIIWIHRILAVAVFIVSIFRIHHFSLKNIFSRDSTAGI